MDAEFGEVETSGNIAGKSFYDFRLLDAVAGADNDTFRYGEITVPVGFVYTYNLRNPATGKHWFPVVAETEAGTADIALAAFFSLNEKGVYNLLSRDGYLAVYSGSETDFEIGAAKAQNETFLLKASAGNLYQHSTTGVGLVDYLHSSLENNGLAAKLQSEFLSDKVVIKNAYMDSATGELLLETEEKEENDG